MRKGGREKERERERGQERERQHVFTFIISTVGNFKIKFIPVLKF